MSPFDRAFRVVIGREGDYADDPIDRGGKTRFGITERIARAFGYLGDMRVLPFDLARSIYREGWWDAMRLDEVAGLSEPVAREMFDTGVNRGQAVAVRYLQRALNVYNYEERHYADITVDGLMGRLTIAALRAFLQRRGKEGESVLLRTLNTLQGADYVGIAERDRSQERFVYGWMKERVA